MCNLTVWCAMFQVSNTNYQRCILGICCTNNYPHVQYPTFVQRSLKQYQLTSYQRYCLGQHIYMNIIYVLACDWLAIVSCSSWLVEGWLECRLGTPSCGESCGRRHSRPATCSFRRVYNPRCLWTGSGTSCGPKHNPQTLAASPDNQTQTQPCVSIIRV